MAASKEERARQFLPFNALTGYYRMILEKQRVSEPKKELSEDEHAVCEKEIDKVITEAIEKIDKLYADKEKDVLSV